MIVQYVVYDKLTSRIVRKFDTMRGARISSAAYNKRDGVNSARYTAIENILPDTIIVKNLMTGKDVEIPGDTPRCCDPSSELYWTM
jgi:hypothetical protein